MTAPLPVCVRRSCRWMCFLIHISSHHLLFYHLKCKSFVFAFSDWLPLLFQMTGLKNTRCFSQPSWLIAWAVLYFRPLTLCSVCLCMGRSDIRFYLPKTTLFYNILLKSRLRVDAYCLEIMKRGLKMYCFFNSDSKLLFLVFKHLIRHRKAVFFIKHFIKTKFINTKHEYNKRPIALHLSNFQAFRCEQKTNYSRQSNHS